MSDYAMVQNMMRNFEQIDKKQPKVEFIPSKEDFCLMIDGKSDGYVYHYTTVIDMINDRTKFISIERFKQMTRMTQEELRYFLANRKWFLLTLSSFILTLSFYEGLYKRLERVNTALRPQTKTQNTN